jgi:catechol 2,3-dioxygenase-like lactoylglutathione lyase family enzyme
LKTVLKETTAINQYNTIQYTTMKSAYIFQKLFLLLSQIFSPLTSASAFILGTISHKSSVKSLQGRQETSTEEQSSISSKASPKKNPIDIFGIDHVVLLVDDLKGMTEWYETVLGCKVAKHNEKVKMIHLDAGSALIDLVDRAGPLGKKNGSNSNNDSCEQQKLDHICLALYDFDEAAIKEHLASHGVAITTDTGVRYGKGGDGESLYFKDPEGTRIELKKSRLLQ